MEGQQRGRSPSSGHQNNIRHTPSPSPHGSFRNSISGPGLDPANQFANNGFNGQLNPSSSSFDQQSQFLNLNQQQQFPQQTDISQHTFLQAQGIQSQNQPGGNFGQQGDNLFSNQFLDPTGSQGNSGVFDAQFMSSSAPQGTIDPSAFLIDPGLENSQPQQQSIDPSNLMSQMGPGHPQSPTPPHLLQPELHRHSSGSPHASPSLQQGGFSPGHSRSTSLDPNRAGFPQNLSAEWSGMNQYRGHQRTPSEAYSDASSVQHSPYMGNNDTFDTNEHHSPLLSSQDPSVFQDISHFGQFSLSESQSRHISPVPSPHISPHLAPQQQQQLPPFTSADNFGLSSSLNNAAFSDPQLSMFTPPRGQEPFPSMPQGGSIDYGHADAMTPPDITIQLAPPSRQSSFEPPKPEPAPEGALSPPGGRKPRSRAQSAPNSRATTPSGGRLSLSGSSLSPSAARISRSPSPSGKGSRRASTSSVQDRTYLIGLADPNRADGGGSGDGSSPGKGRMQKHPATFQCSLCPKRFTRAYNLRSHLRTHTDERPFVCSVCGKAFARQHDRKRHEGLHSGEKKFVCRGTLKDGDTWGCGRRFARADALGRHFRSEAGRVCIRPLLEEEAKEKGLPLPDGQNGENAGAILGPYVQGIQGQPMQVQMPQQGFGQPYQPQPMGHVPLPAALLAQYPALGNMWDTLPTTGEEMEGDMGTRNSFDAGSGYEDDGNDDFSNLGTGPGTVALGWASDYDGRA